MREIKFRAWDKRTKTLKYPVPYDDGVGECPDSLKGKYCPATLKDKNGNATALSDAIMSHNDDGHYVLQQYTGLKDKHGKEIYEGDIIRKFYQRLTINDKEKYIINPVVYRGGGFYVYDQREGQFIGVAEAPSLLEVIGNIYENPELVTV